MLKNSSHWNKSLDQQPIPLWKMETKKEEGWKMFIMWWTELSSTYIWNRDKGGCRTAELHQLHEEDACREVISMRSTWYSISCQKTVALARMFWLALVQLLQMLLAPTEPTEFKALLLCLSFVIPTAQYLYIWIWGSCIPTREWLTVDQSRLLFSCFLLSCNWHTCACTAEGGFPFHLLILSPLSCKRDSGICCDMCWFSRSHRRVSSPNGFSVGPFGRRTKFILPPA